MKLVTWNCYMALQKKLDALLASNGDVMVIQECSKKSIDLINNMKNFSAKWIGTNLNKGLGLIVKHPFKIDSFKDMNLTWAFEARISGPLEFELYGVWACAGSSYDNRYIRQVHLLIDLLEKKVLDDNTIVMGDFNSNAIWDKKYRGRGHSEAVDRLAALELKSAYHSHFNIAQGQEKHPTLFLQKNSKKRYHIDYIFLSENLLNALSSLSVGKESDWLKLSDHMPLVVEFSKDLIF